MTVKTESMQRPGWFIVSEAEKTRSRDQITIAEGEVLRAGQVISKDEDSGLYAAYDNDETTTRDDAAGILFAAVDASDGPKEGVAILRDAEVNLAELYFGEHEDTADKAAAVADLRAQGIICR